EALDKYLLAHGRRGLAAVFERPTVLRSLIERERVTFLLGVKPHDQGRRLAVAWWDTRSLHPLFSGINQLATRVQVELQEILLRGEPDPATADTWGRTFPEEEWYRCLGDDGPSVVSIGSARANHASELCLAQMFGVEPFRPPAGKPDPARFYFLWPP